MQGVDPGGKPVTGGEGGILATNDRQLYERALAYCHLHRAGSVEELTDPVLKQLDRQLLGWKWRAHPLALAIARISLETLPSRLSKYAANRDELIERMGAIPGIEPAHNYAKSGASEVYGGLRFLYDSSVFGGLTVERFCEALQAECVPVSPGGFRSPEHLRVIYREELPGLWGKGHPGPANIQLPRYREGDYPVAEGLNERLLSLGGWIEAAPGLIDQVATAFKKVVDHHKDLL